MSHLDIPLSISRVVDNYRFLGIRVQYLKKKRQKLAIPGVNGDGNQGQL